MGQMRSKVVAVIGGAILVSLGSAGGTEAAALRTIGVLAGASVTASPVVSGASSRGRM